METSTVHAFTFARPKFKKIIARTQFEGFSEPNAFALTGNNKHIWIIGDERQGGNPAPAEFVYPNPHARRPLVTTTGGLGHPSSVAIVP